MKSLAFPAKVNGIYRAPPNTGPLRAAVCAAGLFWATLNLQKISGKRALLQMFSDAAGFPESSGGNWDALADSLQDLSWTGQKMGWVFSISGVPAFSLRSAADYGVLLEILEATADYWQRQGRSFCVLMDGGGEWPSLPVS